MLQWLDEGDEAAATASEQAVNGAHRLTEMLVFVAGINANEAQAGELDAILNDLSASRASGENGVNQLLTCGCMATVRALEVLCHESDPDGVYDHVLNEIMLDYRDGDDRAETAEQQTANALFSAMKLAMLVVEESCTEQEQVDQIEAGYQQCIAENEAAENVDEQMVVVAKWLYKMLGAFGKLHNANRIEMIELLTSRIEANVEASDSPKQQLVQWLYGSVDVLAVYLEYMTIE